MTARAPGPPIGSLAAVTYRVAAALLVCVFGAASVACAQSVPFSPPDLSPVAESATVRPGGSVRLALEVKVPKGLHIQSNHPRDASLIPTALTFDAVPGVSITSIAFPESSDFKLKGSDELYAVFEGDVVVGVVVTVAKDRAPGPIDLAARFRYQACNDSTCFQPKTAPTSWTVQAAAAGPIALQHQDVFRRVAWTRGEAPPAATTAQTPAPAPPVTVATAESALVILDRFTVLNRPGDVNGYMTVPQFLAFLHNAETGERPAGGFEGRGPLAILGLVFLGGLALNLTPCVLPMIPINLAIIGAGSQGARRSRGFFLGAMYGGAMALAYGVLGLVVILTAGTFGAINASPWFNIAIAVLFVWLSLAMFDIVSLDPSRWSSRIRFRESSRGTFLLAFGMGTLAAVLAGACVAPVVIQVIVFSSNLYGRGVRLALALPFVLGLGMALPWPMAGAGFAALPKPGAWMVRVKQVFGLFILVMAAYYGYVAYGIFADRLVDPASVKASAEAQLAAGWHADLAEGLRVAERDKTLVIVDLWATWCKNCLTMDRTTIVDPAVVQALSGYTRIKLQAEDLDQSPAKDLMQKSGVLGLPAYVVLRPKTADR